MKKKQQFEIVLSEVLKLNMDGYNTIFLSTMVLRKIRHPEERLTAIATKAMKTMAKRYGRRILDDKEDEEIRKSSMTALHKTEENYGKTDLVVVAANKSFEALEEALEYSDLPEELIMSGQPVKETFEYLVKKVSKKLRKAEK